MSKEQLPPGEEIEQQSQQHQDQREQVAGDDHHHVALSARLRTQVEFYFSPPNLARDTYLRNMLTAEHADMPSPRPAQLMCPVGVVTNFPKVRDICVQFGAVGKEGHLPEPPALRLAKALEESSVVTVSSEGNWIGPAVQQLPPPSIMGGAPSAMPNAMGGPPAHHFQQPHHFQQQAPHPNFQQGQTASFPQPHPNHMPMMVPPGAAAMQYQPAGMPLPYPPPAHGGQYPNVNAAPMISLGGSESPSSASLESTPSQQQQAAQQQQQGGNTNDVFVAVMDLPAEGLNPIEILSALTTESIRPKSAFLDHGNTDLWFVSFRSETDAKAAILASVNRTIGGMPVRAMLHSELPASSTASLSSTSAPGHIVQQQQPQSVPLMGQPGMAYPLLPQQPSPPPHGMANPTQPMGPTQNIMPAAYPPQYAMPPPQIHRAPQLAGMPPPGQPYPQHQPYYNHQQQMQQIQQIQQMQHMQHVYSGGYMQQQQRGPPQPQQQMMQPYPPPPQMGNRFGVVPPPPPHPRASYPGGPPPPYPYQGMHQQFMGNGYGVYQHQRQYHDRRQGGPVSTGGAGGFHDHLTTRNTKKKKKNQLHQRRELQGSLANDNNNGFRRNNEYNNYGHLRNDSLPAIPGDHGGGHELPWKHKRGEHDQQSFRRTHGNASPSFHRNYNRPHNERLAGTDRTPSAGPLSNRQANKVNERDIFSSSDFPGLGGLGGDEKSEKSSEQGDSKSNNHDDGNNKQQLVGYASALLKKKEANEKNKEAEESMAPTTAAVYTNDVDSITRQMEEMEREILSEFHDLSLIADGTKTVDVVASSSPLPPKANNAQESQQNSNAEGNDDKTEGIQTVGTASSTTMDASARSNPNMNTNNLPILPVGPFPENDGGGGILSQTAISTDPSQKQQQSKAPVIDVTNSQDFPSRESAYVAVDDSVVVVPPSKEQAPPVVVSDDDPAKHVVEKSKPPGAWGSKRFADVI